MKTTRYLLAMTALLVFAMPLLAAGKAKPANTTPDYLAWRDSPEAYFLTSTEEVAWGRVRTKDEADKFIADYWARRGGESFHQEMLARIKAADQYFGLPDRKGSTTEKGRVFILLSSPNQQFEARNSEGRPNEPSLSLGNTGKNNSLEATARARTTWIYKKDRLPQELNTPEMKIIFQTDVSRGDQVIENPGLVEPYLHKFVDWKMAQLFASAAAKSPAAAAAQTNGVMAAASFDSMLWTAADKLNGASFTGEPFISPTEKTFYAASFYLPKATFADAKEVVVAGSIRDKQGNDVATIHQKVAATEYEPNGGDKFADVAVELPPGHYTGVFALYAADEKTLLANVRSDIDVPAPTATRVSPLLLTSRVDTLEKQQPFDPFTFVAMKYAVKGNHRFRPADKIGYFTFFANPAAAPQPSVTMKMKVMKDGKVVDSGSWVPVELSQTGPHTYLLATQFEPNSFSPGHYSLEVRIRDMNADKESAAYKTGYVETAEFDVVQ